jgi:hypothetical protein
MSCDDCSLVGKTGLTLDDGQSCVPLRQVDAPIILFEAEGSCCTKVTSCDCTLLSDFFQKDLNPCEDSDSACDLDVFGVLELDAMLNDEGCEVGEEWKCCSESDEFEVYMLRS